MGEHLRGNCGVSEGLTVALRGSEGRERFRCPLGNLGRRAASQRSGTSNRAELLLVHPAEESTISNSVLGTRAFPQ